MKFEAKNTCPLHNFEPCKQLDCGWFIKLYGENPQNGEQVEEWGCAITMLPLLMVDNTKNAYAVGSAIESLRNEMVNDGELLRETIKQTSDQKLIEG